MSWLTSRKTPALVLLAAALLGVVALWGFYSSPSAAKARERDERLANALEAGATEPAPTLEVDVVLVSAARSTDIVELSGMLEPIRATWVAAEIAGRIIAVPATEFGSIAEGGLIVQIDEALPRAELIRAEANHQLAQSELQRQQRLGRRSVASEAVLDAANAEERRSFAALLEAKTRLAHTRIVAPFDGLVNSLDLDPGAYVQPGTQIAEVLDLSVLEVTVLVGDRQVSVIKAGDKVRVRIDALGNDNFGGLVARVGGAPREGGQRYPVVVALNRDMLGDDARAKIRAGMLAHVHFEVGATAAIRLPTRSVLREFELDYVFVVDEGDVARRVRVATRPVPFRPDHIEITKGLEEDQRVAVSAIGQLRNGMRVIPR